jgi:ABC-type transporter Mla MlaB component
MLTKLGTGQYKLDGILEIRNPQFLSELISIDDGEKITIDFSELESTDSLLLAALLKLSRKIKTRRGSLHLQQVPEKTKILAKTYGIEELLSPHYQ